MLQYYSKNCFLFLCVLLASCSTMKESLTVGLLTGAVTGAVTGSKLNRQDRGKGALTGGLIGAAVGGLVSYGIHSVLEDRDSKVRKNTLFNLENQGVSVPTGSSSKDFPRLTDPKVEEIFVEPHSEGNKFIQGHKVWMINEGATWAEPKEDKRKRK